MRRPRPTLLILGLLAAALVVVVLVMPACNPPDAAPEVLTDENGVILTDENGTRLTDSG